MEAITACGRNLREASHGDQTLTRTLTPCSSSKQGIRENEGPAILSQKDFGPSAPRGNRTPNLVIEGQLKQSGSSLAVRGRVRTSPEGLCRTALHNEGIGCGWWVGAGRLEGEGTRPNDPTDHPTMDDVPVSCSAPTRDVAGDDRPALASPVGLWVSPREPSTHREIQEGRKGTGSAHRTGRQGWCVPHPSRRPCRHPSHVRLGPAPLWPPDPRSNHWTRGHRSFRDDHDRTHRG